MAKFRKKPVVIEAVQLTWANWSEICDFVPRLKGWMVVDAKGKPVIRAIYPLSEKAEAIYYMDYYGCSRIARVLITEIEE